jgi:hypothetical protein
MRQRMNLAAVKKGRDRVFCPHCFGDPPARHGEHTLGYELIEPRQSLPLEPHGARGCPDGVIMRLAKMATRKRNAHCASPKPQQRLPAGNSISRTAARSVLSS